MRVLIRGKVKDFCRKTGCTRQQAHFYLQSEMLPNIRTLEEIANAYGLDPGYFFDKMEVEA